MIWQSIRSASVSPLMIRRRIAGRHRIRVFEKWPARNFHPRGMSKPVRGDESADRAFGCSEQIIGPAREEESELSSNAAFLSQSSRFEAPLLANLHGFQRSPPTAGRG